MATEKTDVVIVGMGAVGGIIAAELGKAGMKVIGLERGPRLTTADFSAHDELRYSQRHDLRPDVKRQPVTWRRNANERANPLPRLDYLPLLPQSRQITDHVQQRPNGCPLPHEHISHDSRVTHRNPQKVPNI